MDRAIRLFQFLMRTQEVRDEPARTVDAYRRDGAVLWFGDLPHHPAVRSALDEGEPETGAPFLTVDRVPRLTPPAPDDLLAEWLDLPCDDPATEPRLRDSIIRATDEVGDDGPAIGCVERLDERPEISEWLRDWLAWADQEPRDRRIRDLYGELFAMYVKALGARRGAGHRSRLPGVDASGPPECAAAPADRTRHHRLRRRHRPAHGRLRRIGGGCRR